MHGENGACNGFCVSEAGSSLLARGKRSLQRFLRERGRIIPACAGKTNTGRTIACARADHPCLRGENLVTSLISLDLRGSSLLARGKHLANWSFTPQIGQILESPESCAYAEIYSLPAAYATDSRDQAQNTDRAPSRPRSCCKLSLETSSPTKRIKYMLRATASLKAGSLTARACASSRREAREGGVPCA